MFRAPRAQNNLVHTRATEFGKASEDSETVPEWPRVYLMKYVSSAMFGRMVVWNSRGETCVKNILCEEYYFGCPHD